MKAIKLVIPVVLTVAVLMILLVLTGCDANTTNATDSNASTMVSQTKKITTGSVGVIKDTNFNGVELNMSQDDFTALGFEFGDSVNIVIDGNLVFNDVPFYNGYYTKTGELLLVSYPGTPYPNFRRAQGTLWDDIDVNEDSTIEVSLNEKGKYLATQEALNMVYSNDRNDFNSDEAFGNFRALRGGSLKDNLIYRSASPADNSYLRAGYVNSLIKNVGVKYSLDLSDNVDEFTDEISKDDGSCQYYEDMYAAGNIALLDLNNNFSGAAVKQSVASALYDMTKHEGPYLIHCTEGKDRTGVVCMLIEALAGASIDEMTDDYMLTYDNYYGITREIDPDKYDALLKVKVDDIFQTISGKDSTDGVTAEDMHNGAVRYLEDGGLVEEQIQEVLTFLSE